jgi:thiol-disulfide isomerase/thioredoxin
MPDHFVPVSGAHFHRILHPVGDTLDKYYKNLTVEVSAGTFKHMLEEQVKMNMKDQSIHSFQSKAAIGLVAPNFELKSLDGTNFSLNSLGDDKIIILDFWGSWCGWCVKGFPKMKTYYEKYKNKMEIIGIANRDSETAWKKSVHENNLTWIQVINDQQSEISKDVPIVYGVKGYPTKFILDKDKKILAIFVGETEEFYRKLDEILKN